MNWFPMNVSESSSTEKEESKSLEAHMGGIKGERERKGVW